MEPVWTHIPIMAPQIAQLLLTNPSGTYMDGTLGLGGHTKTGGRLALNRLSCQL